MTSIRPADIRTWYDSMTVTRDGRGASVRRHVFDLLNAIMSDAASTPLDDEGTTLIPVTPVRFRVPRPDTLHDYVIASREQIWALADAMPPSHRLSVLIAGVMGLREGEVLGLQRGDVELGRSPAILHVRRSAKDGTANGHKARVLGDPKTAGQPPRPGDTGTAAGGRETPSRRLRRSRTDRIAFHRHTIAQNRQRAVHPQ